MRFYNQPHRFCCGVDLHARSLYVCIVDHAGAVVLHQNLPAETAAFLEAITPFREGLVVACECLFCWYWLADLCRDHDIPFVLGHALYMKAIHGGKGYSSSGCTPAEPDAASPGKTAIGCPGEQT